MRYTLYEDPITHKFALLRLPSGFLDGDKLTILATDRWFDSREEARRQMKEHRNNPNYAELVGPFKYALVREKAKK